MTSTEHDDIHHPENDAEYMGLNVNAGVNQPPSVNPNLKNLRKKRRRALTLSEYVEGIEKGNISILSQAVTLVESNKPEHFQLAQQIIDKCVPKSGTAIRLGITGVPGAGKSTFIESLGMHILGQGGKLAVLAIDPSSERTKGSILGDKTRMEQLSTENNAYIRPSPSAGTLGGVAQKTRETIILCEAAGFDTIFVETVGVGQSETSVHSMVDFFLLLMLAGAGDELQGIKRGIMEMADGIAINKADGQNVKRTQIAKTQLVNALHFFPPTDSGWKPEVMTCSAYYHEGVKEVWQMILDYVSFTRGNGYFEGRRKAQSKYWMYESLNSALKSNFYQQEGMQAKIVNQEFKVMNDEMSSFKAARELLEDYFKDLKA